MVLVVLASGPLACCHKSVILHLMQLVNLGQGGGRDYLEGQ